MKFYHYLDHIPDEEVIISVVGEFKFFERPYTLNNELYVVMRSIVWPYLKNNYDISERYELDGRVDPVYRRALLIIGD